MQEKHCDNCPCIKNRQFLARGPSILLSLVVYAIFISIPFRREICSMEKPDGFYPFLAKVFGDTLIQNGHEHISLMPFLLLNRLLET